MVRKIRRWKKRRDGIKQRYAYSKKRKISHPKTTLEDKLNFGDIPYTIKDRDKVWELLHKKARGRPKEELSTTKKELSFDEKVQEILDSIRPTRGKDILKKVVYGKPTTPEERTAYKLLFLEEREHRRNLGLPLTGRGYGKPFEEFKELYGLRPIEESLGRMKGTIGRKNLPKELVKLRARASAYSHALEKTGPEGFYKKMIKGTESPSQPLGFMKYANRESKKGITLKVPKKVLKRLEKKYGIIRKKSKFRMPDKEKSLKALKQRLEEMNKGIDIKIR